MRIDSVYSHTTPTLVMNVNKNWFSLSTYNSLVCYECEWELILSIHIELPRLSWMWMRIDSLYPYTTPTFVINVNENWFSLSTYNSKVCYECECELIQLYPHTTPMFVMNVNSHTPPMFAMSIAWQGIHTILPLCLVSQSASTYWHKKLLTQPDRTKSFITDII